MERNRGRLLRSFTATCIVACLAAPLPRVAQAKEPLSSKLGDLPTLCFATEVYLHAATYERGVYSMLVWANDAYYLCYHDYVMSRVVELEFPNEEPMSFGPWKAHEEYGAEDAAEDGSLTEWAPKYYITHDWSDYGKQILTMIPRDTVRINDVSFVVEGAFDYPKDGYLEEIRDIVGNEVVVIQTCEPQSSLNRIVYGRPS